MKVREFGGRRAKYLGRERVGKSRNRGWRWQEKLHGSFKKSSSREKKAKAEERLEKKVPKFRIFTKLVSSFMCPHLSSNPVTATFFITDTISTF